MISNLDQPYGGQQGTAGDFHGVSVNSGFGFAFTTGSSAFTLDTVTFEIVGGGPTAIHVELLASQGGIFSAAGQLGNPTVDPRQTQWPTLTSFIDYTPATPTV